MIDHCQKPPTSFQSIDAALNIWQSRSSIHEELLWQRLSNERSFHRLLLNALALMDIIQILIKRQCRIEVEKQYSSQSEAQHK